MNLTAYYDADLARDRLYVNDRKSSSNFMTLFSH